MKLCTLAVGEKHLQLAEKLRDGLPAEITIDTKLPPGIPVRKGDRQYDHHNKIYLLERQYHENGTLYLDADAVCTDQAAFLTFVDYLQTLPPGIYSPYVFSSYGFHHPRLPEPSIDRKRLTIVLQFLDSIIPLSEQALLEFRMPNEWMMFFRFRSPAQRISFFQRFRYLHTILIGSKCTLGNDCNLIGLAAQYCQLPVVKLETATGIRHKR